MAADVWDTSKGYRPNPWAKIPEGGFIKALNGDLWARRGEGRAEGEEGGGVYRQVHNETPPQATITPKPLAPLPPQTATKAKPLARPPHKTNNRAYFESSKD